MTLTDRIEALDVETIRKARVAAAAAASEGSRRAYMTEFVTGTDNSHISSIKRPVPFLLAFLAVVPPVFGLLVLGISGTAFEAAGVSIAMKFLCAMNIAFFAFFHICLA